MLERELKSLILKVRSAKAEFQTTEVKRAEGGVPRIYDTLSSFSNQNEGGTILFGLNESDGFSVVRVSDVQTLQKRVMEQCEEMEPPVRAIFTVAEIDGKYVVSAEIPSVDIVERPCFHRAKGRVRGSYIRVGEADKPMTEYEVYSYEAYRKKYQDDIRTVSRAELSSLDRQKLEEYLFQLKRNKPNLANIDDEQIMQLMSIVSDGRPTLTAEMLFGIYPQAFFPQLGIIAVAVPGTEVGDTDKDGARFTDNKRIEGTIPEMLDGALSFVKSNTRKRTIIRNGKRTDMTDYPLNSVREIILNALVHRDYSVHTEGMPIRLTIFEDRLEVTSPGGLYGRLTIDTLGKIQPDTRNPVLANALEVMCVTENRYSGIPTILREMREYGLPEPVFTSERGEFSVCLRSKAEEHTQVNSNDKSAAILDFCKTPRTRAELAAFIGLSSTTYAIKKYVQPLIDAGEMILTLPDTPGSPNQTYTAKK